MFNVFTTSESEVNNGDSYEFAKRTGFFRRAPFPTREKVRKRWSRPSHREGAWKRRASTCYVVIVLIIVIIYKNRTFSVCLCLLLRNIMADSGSQNTAEKEAKLDNTPSADGLEEFDMSVPTYPYKSSSEYAAAVNQWLWQCYNWQCFSMTLPFVVSQTALRIQNNNSDGSTDFNRNFPNTFFPNQNFALQQYNRPNAANQNSYISDASGKVYLVPSLFKRVAAECIDFCVLLILKVAISYIAVEFFDFVNLSKYQNIEEILNNEKIDYRTAMEMTSEILALEIMNRFVVCIFEAVLTYKGVVGGGGATPGKTLMNLRIVSCETVTQLDVNHVRVYPAGDLGLGWAIVRSFIKNFSYAFIFPICCTMYFFHNNRTAYDHICGSIVVEDLPARPHRD